MMKTVYKMRGLKWPDEYADNGMHEQIMSFLKKLMNPQKGADSQDFKSLVAWYYLNTFHARSILSFASKDELVFRVPVSWLKDNAVACIEHMPKMTEVVYEQYLPFAFLTALVVPLEYRITDPTPHVNENMLAVTTGEVRDIIYSAHVGIDPQLRSLKYYTALHAAEKAAAEKAAAEEAVAEEAAADNDDITNPF